MVKGGKRLDEIPVEHFFGPGVYVQVKNEFGIDVLKQVTIEEGDIVLFHTSMINRYSEPVYFTENPEMTEEPVH